MISNLRANGYGSSCRQWDWEPFSPWKGYCPDDVEKCGDSNWCFLPWCYTNATCPGSRLSELVPGHHWSYEVCGAPDCYTYPESVGCPYNCTTDIKITASLDMLPLLDILGCHFGNKTLIDLDVHTRINKYSLTDQCAEHSDIALMTRNPNEDEAYLHPDGFTWQCLQQPRLLTQIDVASDHLVFAVKKNEKAHRCIQALGGLTLAQIRWMYSSLNDSALATFGVDINSVVPNRDLERDTRVWSDLIDHPYCTSHEITILGPPKDTGTFEYFSSEVLLNGESVSESYVEFDIAQFGAAAIDKHSIMILLNHQVQSPLLKTVSVSPDPLKGIQYSYMMPVDESHDEYYLTMQISLNTGAFGDRVNQFLEFVLGSEGQTIIADMGLLPLQSTINGIMATRIGGNPLAELENIYTTLSPSTLPSVDPSFSPSVAPFFSPSKSPSISPSVSPSIQPASIFKDVVTIELKRIVQEAGRDSDTVSSNSKSSSKVRKNWTMKSAEATENIPASGSIEVNGINLQSQLRGIKLALP